MKAILADEQPFEKRFSGRLDLNPDWLAKACAAVHAKGEDTIEYAAATAIREHLRYKLTNPEAAQPDVNMPPRQWFTSEEINCVLADADALADYREKFSFLEELPTERGCLIMAQIIRQLLSATEQESGPHFHNERAEAVAMLREGRAQRGGSTESRITRHSTTWPRPRT